MERPGFRGPSSAALPADRVVFTQFLSFDQHQPEQFPAAISALREGDLVAYRMTGTEVTRDVLRGRLNSVGYGLFRYGHLAIVVRERNPATTPTLRLFSSQSFIGPNTREGLDTLATHNWDAWRLDQWDRVDKSRLYEFVDLAESRAGGWSGYDFSGMFGLWNSNLTPDADSIGHDYICSTIVLAALYYSGVQLDALRNHGWLDICTPYQIVSSAGRVINPPPVTFATDDSPTSTTINFPSPPPEARISLYKRPTW